MKASAPLLAVFVFAFPAFGVLAPSARAEAPSGVIAKTAEMAYLRGMLAERRGAYAEALEAYEQALAADPNSAFICRQAAELSLEIGQPDKAERWARKVVELEPKSASSHLLIGRVCWALGRLDEAEASFETALKLDPKSAETIFSLGSLLAAKSPQKARELLQRFLEQNPEEAAEAHFQLAKIDLQEGRFPSSEKELKASIELDPEGDALPARYALAQAYETQHSTQAALDEYLQIAKIESQNAALLNHIGQIYFANGEYDKARAQFQEAKNAQPDDPTANHWLALDAEREGDYLKAATYLRSSAALKDEPALSMRLSYYLTQAGRLNDAVSVLEAGLARWPNNDQLAYFLALGYDDLKRDADAIKVLRKALALKPDFRDARYQLGVLLEKTGDITGAEAQFRDLLADKPDDAAVLNYLGYSLADRGLKLGEAEDMIARAVALDPQNAAYQDSLGWARFKLGRSTEALSDLLAALKGLPEDETVWEHVGDAYDALGEREKAWLFWRRAESLATEQSPLPQKSRKLERRFSSEKLGELSLDFFRLAQGGLKKVSGLCDIKAAVLGHSMKFRGLLTFKGQELDVDLLGPLFTPLFRVRAGPQGFQMDPIHVEGLDDQAVADAAAQLFTAARAYLSGELWTLRPARYEKHWRSRFVDVPGWKIKIAREGGLAVDVSPAARPDFNLELQDFARYEGRFVPKRLVGSGRGYTMSIEFDNVKLDLEPLTAANDGMGSKP